MDRAARYLGIARKAGFLTAGEENCGAVVRAGKAKLLCLAADASDNAARRAEGFVHGTKTPLLRVPYTKDELADCLGTGSCSMAALTDIGLASSFVSALCEDRPELQTLSEELFRRNEKAAQRRREAQAHERNKRTGKRRKNI